MMSKSTSDLFLDFKLLFKRQIHYHPLTPGHGRQA